MAANPKGEKFVTPEGRAKYPYLNTADFQFDTDGKFKTRLIVDAKSSKAITALVDDVLQSEFGDKAKWPKNLRVPFEVDEEDETKMVFKFSSNFKPKMYGWDGKVIPEGEEPTLWGGSLIKVGGIAKAYNNGSQKGAGLYCNKVQILEVVGPDSDDEGFESMDEYKPDGFDREREGNSDADFDEETADF